MRHKDFISQYMQIKQKEVETLNAVLEEHFNSEYRFNNGGIYIEATIPKTSTPVQARLLEVKAPVTCDGGIFVKPVDYVDEDYIETGYLNIAYGDIDYILDNMPEPKKSYTFRWDGGNLPMRETKLEFDCDADAMKSAREFQQANHIDIITVFEGEGNGTRRVVSYSK